MQLKEESKLVRWAYLMSEYTPSRVSLCVLFWRVVLVTPLKVALCLAMAAALFMIGWTYPMGSLAAVASAVVFVIWLYYVTEVRPYRDREDGLVVSYLKAKKQKFCPIIEIKRCH